MKYQSETRPAIWAGPFSSCRLGRFRDEATDRLRLQREIVHPVEVAFETEVALFQMPRRTRMNSSERRYRSSCSSQGSPSAVNSPLNQPLTTFTANLPPEDSSVVAPSLATTPEELA